MRGTVFVFLFIYLSVATAATIKWTAASGGKWTDCKTCWDLGRIPKEGDDVLITMEGEYTVSIDASTPGVKSVTLGSASNTKVQTLRLNYGMDIGTLTTEKSSALVFQMGGNSLELAAPSTVAGAVRWVDGSVRGKGAASLRVSGAVSIVTKGTVKFDSLPVAVTGAVEWTEAGVLSLESCSMAATGGLTVLGATELAMDGDSLLVLSKDVSFKVAGKDAVRLSGNVKLVGANVAVEQGAVSFLATVSGNETSSLSVSKGASAEIHSFALDSTSSLAVEGTLTSALGTSVFGGASDSVSLLQMSGGTVSFDGSATVVTLKLDSGNVGGSGSLAVDNLQFSTGALKGSGGTVTVKTSLSLEGNSAKTLDGVAVVVNEGASASFSQGTVTLKDAASITLGKGVHANFPNRITFDTPIDDPSPTKFSTEGDVTVTGAVEFHCDLAVDGKLDVKDGGSLTAFSTLDFNGPVTLDGDIFTTTKGPWTFHDTLGGSGHLTAGPGGVTKLSKATTLGRVSVTGTLDIDQSLKCTNNLAVDPGTLTGPGTTEAFTLSFLAGSIKTSGLVTCGTLSQQGTVTLDGTHLVVTRDGAMEGSQLVMKNDAKLTIGSVASVTSKKGLFINAEDHCCMLEVNGSVAVSGLTDQGSIYSAFNLNSGGTFTVADGSLKVTGFSRALGKLVIGTGSAPAEFLAVRKTYFDPESSITGTGTFALGCEAEPKDCGAQIYPELDVGGLRLENNVEAELRSPSNTVKALSVKLGKLWLYGSISAQTFHWEAGTIQGFAVLASTVDAPLGGAVSTTSSKSLVGTTLHLGGAVDVSSSVQLSKGASIVSDGKMTISDAVTMTTVPGLTCTVVNNGDLTVTTDEDVTFQVEVQNNGQFKCGKGTVNIKAGFSQAGQNASFVLNGGSATTDDSWLFVGGTISGSGSFDGDVGLNGDMHVGAGEKISMSGDFFQGPSSTVVVDAAEGGAGKVEVAGQALVNGQLAVHLTKGYTPATGATVEAVTFSSHVGTFRDVRVVTEAGTLDDSYTVSASYTDSAATLTLTLETPKAKSVLPAVSPKAGGTKVTIAGSAFSGQKVSAIFTIAGSSSKSVPATVTSASTAELTVPAMAKAGTGKVVVKVGDKATFDFAFAVYGDVAVTTASPAFVWPGGGVSVTLTGTGFVPSDAALVSFNIPGGASALVSAVVLNDNSVRCVTPALGGARSTDLDVALLLDGQTPVVAAKNTLAITTPTISSLVPNAVGLKKAVVAVADVDAGTIAVAGTGLLDASYARLVYPGGNATVAITAASGTHASFSAPELTGDANFAAEVYMSYDGERWTDALATMVYYTEPGLANLVPQSGYIDGGDTLVIFGSGFVPSDTITVRFVDAAGTTHLVNGSYGSSTVVSCTTPACPEGLAQVTVSVSGGVFTTQLLNFAYSTNHNTGATSSPITTAPPATSSSGDSSGSGGTDPSEDGDTGSGTGHAVGVGVGVGLLVAVVFSSIFAFVLHRRYLNLTGGNSENTRHLLSINPTVTG